ncbi:MAG: hypothetical protein VX457_04605, partial [Actinomycetota bacterium]|nr:hypothetical protein [Actinomycetota bacterium]
LHKRDPFNEGAIETPNANDRRFKSKPAVTAAITVPSSARTDTAANCDDPPKTRDEKPNASQTPTPDSAQRAPNANPNGDIAKPMEIA